jgi:hypothetical protein
MDYALQFCLENLICPLLTPKKNCILASSSKNNHDAFIHLCNENRIKWERARILLYTFRTESNGLCEDEGYPDKFFQHFYVYRKKNKVMDFTIPFKYREITVDIQIDPVTFQLIVKIWNFFPEELVRGDGFQGWFPVHPLKVKIDPIPGAELDGRYLGEAPEEFPTFSDLRTWIRELEHDVE